MVKGEGQQKALPANKRKEGNKMTKAQQKAKAKEHMRDLKGWKAWYKNLGENDKVIEIAERQFQYRCFLVEMEIATNKEIDKWENTWEE